MPIPFNLSLTDELRAFVDQNSGDGTLYATPSEFVRDVLREKSGWKRRRFGMRFWKVIKTRWQAERWSTTEISRD